MPVLSYGRAITWHAERTPDRVALVHEGRKRSWAELDARSNRLARAYAEQGVGVGDLVTIGLPNGCEFFEAAAAAWKLGATPQPVSARLPKLERRAIVNAAGPALVVGVPKDEFPNRPTLPLGYEPPATLSDAPLPDVTPPQVRCMTSGGSTGLPKLILDLTPGNVDPEVAVNGMRRGGVTLVAGPLYHAGPFITSWQCLLAGGSAVVMTRFDAAQALALIEKHRIEWVLFVPTMMQRIWRLPKQERERHDLGSIVRVMCTGAPSPAWLKQAWIDWIGPERVWESYGGSERIAGTQIGGVEWLDHPGSVGKPTEGRKIRVLRPDGSECEPGEVGEIYMMPAGGQGTTYRYIGAEMPATGDGWETLGDLGHRDEEGYLYLADRKSDMIVTGGANVYPAEVEAALDAHPAVRSSAVVGLPDDDLGQRIHAIVDAPEANATEDAMREHLAEHLVRYKVPRSFEFVTHVLRDDAGKLRRSALRDARIAEQPS
ncbi:MAG: AMP-binding protein [Deltaproteobacteria bacterium]|nr:AMP-binding protein [Deltaproteobacteria bacterium]MBW2359428.1 AMP-binding protein [Deltaproteobacteria bacterium]